MTETEFETMEITDDTIPNVAKATDTGKSIAGIKRWGAIVNRNLSKPGGLERRFLEDKNKGQLVVLGNLAAGDYLELAHKITYYCTDGLRTDYQYFQVIERLPNQLIVKKVDKGDVPPASEQTMPAPPSLKDYTTEQLEAELLRRKEKGEA